MTFHNFLPLLPPIFSVPTLSPIRSSDPNPMAFLQSLLHSMPAKKQRCSSLIAQSFSFLFPLIQNSRLYKLKPIENDFITHSYIHYLYLLVFFNRDHKRYAESESSNQRHSKPFNSTNF